MFDHSLNLFPRLEPLFFSFITGHFFLVSTFVFLTFWARSIQPKFPEISVQHSMDQFSPTAKVWKKQAYLLRWTIFPGWTGRNFGWMAHAL